MRVSHFGISAPMLALALAFAPVATGEDYSVSIPVSTADIASDTALAALHGRIQTAAEDVCRDSLLNTSPYIRSALRTCAAYSTDEAVAASGIPELVAYHAARQTVTAQAETRETLASR